MCKLEGVQRELKWGLGGSQYNFSLRKGEVVTVKEIVFENQEALAVVNWYKTTFDYNGLYTVKIEERKLHLEALFTSFETTKLSIRAKSMVSIPWQKIEETLSFSIEDLTHYHRGSLKSRKFGL